MAEDFVTPVLAYDTRDYESIRDDIISRIQFYIDEWTDHNPDDFGIVLIELFAGMADVLHWYIDRQANECYLETALSRRAVRLLLQLIGIRLKSAQPARVNVIFSISSPLGYDLTIPEGTRIATAGAGAQIVFETDEDVDIPTGQLTSPEVAATQGETKTEAMGTSDGTQFQKFPIALTPVIDDSWSVLVDITEWTAVESLALAGPSDEVFAVTRDEDDLITIEFGDGINGKIPASGATLTFNGRVGGGVSGNVGIGAIRVVLDTISPPVQVTNPVRATGGEDREDIRTAKARGPLELKSLKRAVTLDDYQGLTEAIAGVEKAQAILAGIALIHIYIVPTGGGTASPALLAYVLSQLDTFRMASDGVEVFSANEVTVDLTAEVHVLSQYLQSAVVVAVEDAVENYFDPALRPFGEEDNPRGDIRIGDVFAMMENVRGVDFVELSKLTMVPRVDWRVKTGDAYFGPIGISSTTIAETWEVRFINPTDFNVRGSVSGLQAATGTLDTPYASDGGEVSFTLNSGTSPMSLGDIAQFRVSDLLGSVDVLPTEVGVRGTVTLTYIGGV